jgi:hypothetical protein
LLTSIAAAATSDTESPHPRLTVVEVVVCHGVRMSMQDQTSKPFTEVTTHIDVDMGDRNRLTTFFRPILVIPAAILLAVLTNAGVGSGAWMDERRPWADSNGGGLWGIPLTVMIPALLLLVFAATYPLWLLKFAHGVQSFDTKVNVYCFLLRDEYPSVKDKDFAFIGYPDIEEGRTLSRGLPLVKWLLALPHYVVLILAFLGVLAVSLVAWIAILFTGRYPQSLAKWPVGFISYWNRVAGYAFYLVTDSYPRIRT